MNRRHLLSLTLASTWLAGCASRVTPPTTPVDLKTVGLLPLKEWEPNGSTAPFSVSLLGPAPSGGSPAPINPMTLGLTIGNAIRSSQAAERRNLAHALADLDFDAGAVLSRRVLALIAERGMPIVAVDDAALAEAVWTDSYRSLPREHDAILDIQIHGAGYYPARGIGLVPYLSVGARLLDTRRPRQVIDQFSYEVAHGDAKGDPRFHSCPSQLIVTDLVAFKRESAAIRQGLNDVYARVSQQIVDDVDRVLRKQPRID